MIKSVILYPIFSGKSVYLNHILTYTNTILKRKIESEIIRYFQSEDAPILLIEGARQVGKSYIIRHLGREHFTNFVELNMIEDKNGPRIFENIRSTKELYMAIQSVAGKKLGDCKDTLVFIDEIQEYDKTLHERRRNSYRTFVQIQHQASA